MPTKLHALPILLAAAVIVGSIFIFTHTATAPHNGLPEGIKLINRAEDAVSLVNTKEGYSMVIPKGWKEEPITSTQRIALYSPEALMQKTDGDLEQGCKITTTVSTTLMTLEELQKDDPEELELYTIEENEYSTIEVGGFKAVKNIFKAAEAPFSISVSVPTNNKVYSFSMGAGEAYQKQCTEDFDKFIQTISFLKHSP